MGSVARDSWPTSIVEDIGGVRFEGDQHTLAHALVGLGLAARILVRIAIFPVTELSNLDANVGRLSWSGWLKHDVPRVIRASAKKSRLYHSGAIEQRVMQGITSQQRHPRAYLPQLRCLLRSRRAPELVEAVGTKDRTNRGPCCHTTSAKNFGLLRCNFRSQVTIGLKLREQFQRLLSELKDSHSHTAFVLIKGLAAMSGLYDIEVELRCNGIDHLASILSRSSMFSVSGVVKSLWISHVQR